jgi:hypothetical protein
MNDEGYGIHMSREAQRKYVKLQDKIKWYLDNYNEDGFNKKNDKEKIDIREYFVDQGY